MKRFVILFSVIFFVSSCSKDSETSVISQELKNQNVVDDQTTQKSKSIKTDFEKDLDTFLQTSSGGTATGSSN